MKILRHTVQWRLKQWGDWTLEPRRDWGHSSSPFGKIAEMQENAGIRADGIRYEIIEFDGESISCPPDGGMWAEVERQGKAMAFDIKCREVEQAVSALPQSHRLAVIHTYVVGKKEDPRSSRVVADLMKISHKTVSLLLKEAHKRVADAVYGVFQVLPSDEEASLDEAA